MAATDKLRTIDTDMLVHKAAPLYELDSAIVENADYNSLMTTCEGMQSMGLLRLPYPQIYLRVWVESYINNNRFVLLRADQHHSFAFKAWITFLVVDDLTIQKTPAEDLALRVGRPVRSHMIQGTQFQFGAWINYVDGHHGAVDLAERSSAPIRSMYYDVAAMLIVALATRNVAKQTTSNGRFQKGKPSKSQFRGPNGITYITRTRLVAPVQLHAATGRKMPMHLRAGHPHTFRYGIGKQLTKVIFVPPLWVNRDDNTPMPEPRTYRVMG